MKYNFFLLKYSNRLLLLVAISLMLITCDIKDNDNLQNLSTIDRARLYTLFFYDSHFKKLHSTIKGLIYEKIFISIIYFSAAQLY